MIAGFLFPGKIDHFDRMTPMRYILLLQGDATAFPGRDNPRSGSVLNVVRNQLKPAFT